MARRTLTIAFFVYGGLVLYGSLYPFTGWRLPDGDALAGLTGLFGQHVSRADAVTNLLAYIPFGYLAAALLGKGGKGRMAVTVATVLGCLLSASVEFLQIFLPSRVSSLVDLALNGCGTFAGAYMARWWRGESDFMQRLHLSRHLWFLPGWRGDCALAVTGVWALSQLAPFVPSIDMGNLRAGLKPLWHTLHDPGSFRPAEAAVYAFSIAGLGGIVQLAARERWRVMVCFALFVAAVLLSKVPVVGRQLSLEAVAGCAAAFAIIPFSGMLPRKWLPVLAGAAIAVAFCIDELRPAAEKVGGLHPFNWVPFHAQMANLMGFVSILEGIWPFAALAFFALAGEPKSPIAVASWGGLAIFSLTYGLERAQLDIPGRYPDITQVVLALAGWTAPFIWTRGLHADGPVDDRRRVTQ